MLIRLNSLWFRLFLGYTIPLALLVGAALVAVLTGARLLTTLERQAQSQELIARGNEVKEHLADLLAAESTYHLLADPASLREFEEGCRGLQKDLRAFRQSAEHNPQYLVRLGRAEEGVATWYDLARKDAAAAGKVRWEDRAEWEKILENLRTRQRVNVLSRTRDAVNDILTDEQRLVADRRRSVQQHTWEGIAAIGLIVVVTVGLCFGLSLQLGRTVTRPIHRLRNALAGLPRGEFEMLPPVGPAEVAQLTRGFNLMSMALAERQRLLQSSEHRYRTVVGSLSNILWTTDAQGQNGDLSAWAAFTGQPPDEAASDGMLLAVHPDDRARFADGWADALARKSYAEEEVRIRRADGCYRSFLCRSVPVLDDRKELREWVRVCIDVTEQKQEEILRREKEAAEAANRAKSEFLARMSHELRTPLNAVIGMSKMLTTQRFGPLNAKQQDYLADITSAGEHLLALINDILDLSKIEAGRMELTPEPIPVGDTVALVLSTLRTLAETRRLKLTHEPPAADGLVHADLARFKQILYNLVSNAVKFTPPGGSVAVRCRWAAGPHPDAALLDGVGPALRVEVEDTGVGIAPEDQQLLGTEFYQGRRDPSKSQEGTGLGLALTRRLVQLMGGAFWFRSAPGQGSCFSFALPARPTPAGADGPLSPVGADAPGTGAGEERPLALIIDDHRPTNKLLADWLQGAGLRTASAFDGHDGLDQARRLMPRLILVDIRLPRLDGWQVLAELKSDPATASIPAVIVSVLEGRDLPQAVDVVDWFVKPLDRDRMIHRLRAACPGLFAADNTLSALVVDDNPAARKLLRDLLAAEGVDVLEAGGGAEALQLLDGRHRIDLVLLDLLMPGVDGFAVVEALRAQERWERVPIFITTVKDLTPEDVERLNGRIQAILRKEHLTRAALGTLLQEHGLPSPAAGTA